MNEINKTSEHTTEKGVFHAPWEKSFDKILITFEEFIHRQITCVLLLMGTAVIVLLLANGPPAAAFAHLVHTHS